MAYYNHFMRALIQRVKQANVLIKESLYSQIGSGLLILLGVSQADFEKEASFLAEKIQNLRIFEDEQGKMNLSLIDVKGEALIVSQFTLYADCQKGRRPSFTDAAGPEKANTLYEFFVSEFRKTGLRVETGQFQAMMDVSLTNWGPVTIMLEA